MKLMRSRLGVTVLSLSALAAGYIGGRPLLERIEFSRALADVQATRQQLSTVEDLSTVFRHVGKVVEPSVVNIEVHKMVHQQHTRLPEDQLRKFFRDHGMNDVPNFDNNGDNNENGDSDPGVEEQGTGSGVIMDVDGGYGYILTNNHVAGTGSTIDKVTLADGRVLTGADCKLLGADPKGDLAVIRVKADRLIAAKWGNSDDLEKGDWVMAFGSPFGYVGSMTHGIVSALNRNQVIPDRQAYEDFIQVDAPINPGNSGGPLVNIHGEVVGINTAIATVSGGFQGIGFAIPSNSAQVIYKELKTQGKVVRGWLGVGIKNVSDMPDVAKFYGYTGSNGIMVQQTFPNTPASGKLKAGDIITAINNQPVTDVDHLRNIVADTAPNTVITLRVFRDQKDVDVPITLGSQPEDLASMMGGNPDQTPAPQAQDQTPQVLGMTLKTLDANTAESLGLQGVKSGAVITAIERNSAAALAGLEEGEVITEVGRTPVHTAEEASAALQKADLGKGVPLYVATREGSEFVFLKTPDASK
jgi:serine protease Do